MKKKILIIGSAPDAIVARKWVKHPFHHVVAINNAWQVRKDWTHCIFPEDFPAKKQPNPTEDKTLHSAKEYVKAQNHFGGFVYAGGTMAFTAGYWVLYKFRPNFIGYIGCDMIYKGYKTHFYGKGNADPLREDKTLKNLPAKSARLAALASMQGCRIVNFSELPQSNLIFPRQKMQELYDGIKPKKIQFNQDKIKLALNKEKELGYFVKDGKYWKKMKTFDSKKIQELDSIWMTALS